MNIDKIELDDLSKGLYQVHLDRKNYRICNAIRTLILRKDFTEILKRLENEGIYKEKVDIKPAPKKDLYIWRSNQSVTGPLIHSFVESVSQSVYIRGKNDKWQDAFSSIAQKILHFSYADTYANQRNKNNLFSNTVMIDDATNYPNITQLTFTEKAFWGVFEDAFYGDMKAIEEKYGKHPQSIRTGGGRLDEIPEGISIEPSEPKVCMIVIDDTTEKQELIDYIEKQWGTIEIDLKSLRPSREEKRITTSQTFLRDIDIYNKYQSYKEEGYKNPDVKVSFWLKDESEYQVEIEPNTIRKIVSLMKTDIDSINAETKEK